jgi:FkbH-like protein
MRLSEALKTLQQAPKDSPAVYRTFLSCGFTPLHLKTFLAAHLQLAFPQHRVEIETGLYGDLFGNIERLKKGRSDGGVVIFEWSDLDARLGLRSLAGWNHAALPEIADHVGAQLDRLRDALKGASQISTVVLCLPTLPLPPIQPTAPRWSATALDFELQERISSFARWVVQNTSVKVVSPDWLHRLSPDADRFDAKSDLLDGFPYKIPHASAIAEAVAKLAGAPQPKKGLITDLDNTLWKGILGDIGPEQISWELDRKSHTHALYQSLLDSLAKTGVLIAVASKNDAAMVDRAFDRKDLILSKEHIFPSQVHWGPKSKSVSEILKTWNIGPESVTFIDDSEIELAEVKAVHPDVECILFPSDPNEVYLLLERLRDQFAKPVITAEDTLRLASIRSASVWREESGEPDAAVSDAFLEKAQSVLTLDFHNTPWDPRVLELLNKTNQFNLNGERFTETGLRATLTDPQTMLLKVSYQDKFGSLGKISVLLGRLTGATLHVDAWVLSCRAFSRRIEFACLAELFARFPLETLTFQFAPTDRNTPLREFFTAFPETHSEAGLSISRDLFFAKCPRLFHRVEETIYA